MSTIKGVGNKSLTHTNSLNTITTKVPEYGVVTAHEKELGGCLDNIRIWGIDVFRIAEFSNNRPLTAVTYRVFQDRDLLSLFKIPASNLVALLLTLEDHYLKVMSNTYQIYLYIQNIFAFCVCLFVCPLVCHLQLNDFPSVSTKAHDRLSASFCQLQLR